jgi:hypothetical protein
MSIENLAGQVNPLPDAPDMVIMNSLRGAEVEIMIDPELARGAGQLVLEPPEAFSATLDHGRLRVENADGAPEDGRVTLRLGPQDPDALGMYIAVRTTRGDVRARGTPENPLRARGIGLATNSNGCTEVEHVTVLGNLRLHPETADRVIVAGGVIAHRIIRQRAS